MPNARLSPQAIRRTIPKLHDEMGRADRERLDLLLPLFQDAPEANLGTVLETLFPGMTQEAALTAFRQFRKRLKDAATDIKLNLQLEADTQTRSLPEQRSCWFEGDDGAIDAVIRLAKEETENVRRSGQGAFELRDSKPIIRYFLSFAHKDDRLQKDLIERLNDLLQSASRYHFEIWHDGLILPGDQWHQKIQNAIENCHFGLLLVSPAFLASPYIREHELPQFVPDDGKSLSESKRAIPVCIKPLPLDGSLDLKGLQHQQVFLDDEGKAFSERVGSRKDAFAKQLFTRIDQIVGQRIVPANKQKFTLRHSFEKRLVDHMDHQMETCPFVPTEGFAGNLEKLDSENRSDDKIPRIDALNYLLEWVEDPKAPAYCALLGEYGIGKTTTCMAFTQGLLKKRLSNKNLPLPIYLDLRHLGDNAKDDLSLEHIIDVLLRGSWLSGELKTELNAAEIIRLVQQEGALLIFDGLDEVLVHLSESAGQRFTRELLRALPPRQVHNKARNQSTTKPGKLLLSCRTHFFRTLRDQKNLFLGEDREPLTAEDYRAFVLMPFTEDQIRRYLHETLPDQDTDRLIELIGAIHNLTEMAERPYTLSLISRHIPQLEQWKLEGRKVTGVTLYRHMVLSWLERDTGKHQLTTDHKQRLMEYFSAELWRSGRRTWSVNDIEQWLIDLLDAHPEIAAHYHGVSRELLKEDLRTATFLVRSGEDQFRFAHSSLQEFFLACHLYRALLEQSIERWALPPVSPETLDFLGQLLIEDANNQTIAMKSFGLLRDSYQPLSSELAFTYALRAQDKGHPYLPQSGARLEGINLCRIQITGKPNQLFNLRKAVFSNAHLEETVFEHVDLEGADFSQSIMTRANLLNCRAPDSNFTAADLAGTVFRDSRLQSARFLDAHCHRTQWLGCKLGDAIGLPDTAPEGFFAQCTPTSAVPSCQTNPVIIGEHSSEILSLCFSPCGNYIVTASADYTLRLWDAESGECMCVFTGHENMIRSVAYSPNGKQIASGSDDKTLRLWDADSGECLTIFTGHEDSINGVAISPNSKRIASGSDDKTIRLWDLESGKCITTITGHEDRITCIAYSPNGKRIASSADDRTLRQWDVDSGNCLTIFNGHKRPLNGVTYSPDGKRIASCADDATLRLWDAESGDCLATFTEDVIAVNAVTFSPDGTHIISVSDDRTLRLLDADSGECITTLTGHNWGINAATYSPDGKRIASASRDNTLRLWNANSGQNIAILSADEVGVSTLAISPDAVNIVTGSWGGKLRLWNMGSGKNLTTFVKQNDWIIKVAYSHDGTRIASSSYDHTLRLWDAISGVCLTTLTGHDDTDNSVAFSPNGKRIASSSRDNTLRLWDTDSGECLTILTGHDSDINALAYSPDGKRIASGSWDKTLRLWDADSGECLAILTGHMGSVNAVTYSPDGKRIASGSQDKTLRQWDAETGVCLSILTEHKYRINSVAYSPDGKHIVSTSHDQTLRLWDVENSTCIATIAIEGGAREAHYSPDGLHIVAGGNRGIFIYDAHTPTLLRRIYLFDNDTWINLDVVNQRIDQVHGETWRYLRWRGIDPATGKPELWPAEIYGPLPE